MSKKKFSKALAARNSSATSQSLSSMAITKTVSRVRQDIKSWNLALNMARQAENPKWFAFQLLLNEIAMDAHLRSQIQNRMNRSISTPFIISGRDGKIKEDLTNAWQNTTWITNLNLAIIASRFYKHSLIEFSFTGGELQCTLLPRTNVDPIKGRYFKDYHDDNGFIKYRELPDYGRFILEFGEPDDLGLLNNCVPHVLMKRFAQSCWSELCEIYGIPPRVMKTNTHDPVMRRQAETMMRDMGAAAWFVIDSTEQFEWAKGVDTNGDVYKNLIQLCNNEMSMAIQGAVIGQDTANGNRSKEESSQNLLQDLVDSDLSLLEQMWNSKVIPALRAMGVITEDVVFGYPKAEDLEKLWKMTTEALEHYDVAPDWINETFGIPVEPKKPQAPASPTLSFGPDFFV